MPVFFKLITRACLAGIAVGWTILALFIITNTGGIGEVVRHSSDVFLGVFLMAFGFAITFGSLFMGVAIMTIPHSDIEFGDDGVNPNYKFPY